MDLQAQIHQQYAAELAALQARMAELEAREADVHLLSTVAANVGAAIANARLYAETQRSAREMAALAEVGRELSASLDPAIVLELIAAHARELLGGDGFGVLERLRARTDQSGIPVVVLTAKSLSSDESARLSASATKVIQKQGLFGELPHQAAQRRAGVREAGGVG